MLIALFLLILILNKYGNSGRKYSFVIIIWTTYLYMITEVLSLFRQINQSSLIFVWGAFDLILLVLLYVICRKSKFNISINAKKIIKIFKQYPMQILIAFITFLWALGTIPNNWDSMTYQLTRVAHWAQNESVAHFATNNTRQVASPVLSAFINLHVYILSGKRDFLCNLLQWSCYVTNAWFVYHIARKIGCNNKFSGLSSLLFLCMPIAFAEALTTQVDHFATLWLLIFTYFFLDFISEKKIICCSETIIGCIAMSVCVAYGYLSKPTVSIAMLLMVLALLIVCILRRDSVIQLIKLLVIVIPIMVILISTEIIRNYITFNALNPPNVGQRQIVGTIQPNYVFVNFLKNFTFNIPNIYLYRSERIVNLIVTIAAAVLGVELNHPSISEDGRSFLVHTAQTYGHDTAVNPVILFLAILCVIWGLCREIKKQGNKVAMTCYAFFMFCVFCCIVRWEPYVSRYMLPYLAILCPIIGLQMQDLTENCKWNTLRCCVFPCIICVCVIDLFAMTWFHGGIMKGSWKDSYYVNRLEIAEEYQELKTYIRQNNYEKIGLIFMTDDGEYPLWDLSTDGIWIEHIETNNDTEKYALDDYIPDCILKTYNAEDEFFNYKGEEYKRMEICEGYEYLWIYTKC